MCTMGRHTTEVEEKVEEFGGRKKPVESCLFTLYVKSYVTAAGLLCNSSSTCGKF